MDGMDGFVMGDGENMANRLNDAMRQMAMFDMIHAVMYIAPGQEEEAGATRLLFRNSESGRRLAQADIEVKEGAAQAAIEYVGGWLFSDHNMSMN